MYGICMLFCSICYMMMGFHAALNIPCANVYIMRLIMSIILSFVVIRSFVKHVQLIAKVGDAYHRMVRDYGSAECFQLSMACFGDPTALRDMYDTNEVFKSHAWVVFAYPVDSTLVWTIITSAVLAIALTMAQTF